MMETNNPLGLNDFLMVERVKAESPRGGPVTLAVYERFSALGFVRLRHSTAFRPLADFEKRELAYDAAGLFLQDILSGKYEPRDTASSCAYFWTICRRRAVDALRKFVLQTAKSQNQEVPGRETPASEAIPPAPSAFASRHSIDEFPGLNAQVAEKLHDWLDARLLWETARRKLGGSCYEILVETLQKDRAQAEISAERGYAVGTLKALKTKCLAQLRALVRDIL